MMMGGRYQDAVYPRWMTTNEIVKFQPDDPLLLGVAVSLDFDMSRRHDDTIIVNC